MFKIKLTRVTLKFDELKWWVCLCSKCSGSVLTFSSSSRITLHSSQDLVSEMQMGNQFKSLVTWPCNRKTKWMLFLPVSFLFNCRTAWIACRWIDLCVCQVPELNLEGVGFSARRLKERERMTFVGLLSCISLSLSLSLALCWASRVSMLVFAYCNVELAHLSSCAKNGITQLVLSLHNIHMCKATASLILTPMDGKCCHRQINLIVLSTIFSWATLSLSLSLSLSHSN